MLSLIFLPPRPCAACLFALFISLSPLLAFACNDPPNPADPGGTQCPRNRVPATLLLATAGGAFFLGAEDRFGKSFRRTQEAVSAVEETKQMPHLAPIRLRSLETDNAGNHSGSNHSSNPQASDTAALVTPFILSYKDDHPAVWLLASLPAYEMATQMNGNTQRQKDALAGAALGGMKGYYKGYYEHDDGSWVFRLRPRGVFIGYRKILE